MWAVTVRISPRLSDFHSISKISSAENTLPGFCDKSDSSSNSLRPQVNRFAPYLDFTAVEVDLEAWVPKRRRPSPHLGSARHPVSSEVGFDAGH
jgi:hypothetical protein